MHAIGPLKRSHRIPLHITISQLSGEAHATNATNRRTYLFGRKQLEEFVEYDGLLRRRGYFDQSDAIPSAYGLWCRLWDQDLTCQYGWATLTNSQVVLGLESDRVPSNLLLPRLKGKSDEVHDQAFVQGLVKAAAKNYVREQNNRDWHVSKRAEKRARREALSSHAARFAPAASLSDLDEVSSIFTLPSELPLPFEDASTSAGSTETTIAAHAAVTTPVPVNTNTDTDTDANPVTPQGVATTTADASNTTPPVPPVPTSPRTVEATPPVPQVPAVPQPVEPTQTGPLADNPTLVAPVAGPSSTHPAAGGSLTTPSTAAPAITTPTSTTASASRTRLEVDDDVDMTTDDTLLPLIDYPSTPTA